MGFLLRATVLLALLASLAYGSYAFGRYVLSHHLFADGIKVNAGSALDVADSTRVKGVTRAKSYSGRQAQADVQVLTAQEDGAGPEAPAPDVLEQQLRDTPSTARPPLRSGPQSPSGTNRVFDKAYARNGDVLTGSPDDRRSRRRYDDGSSGYNNGYDDRYSRRRSRRRSYRRDRSRTARNSGSNSGSTGAAPDDSPRLEAPRLPSDNGGTHRRDASRATAPTHRDAPSAPSSGGESPVPVPE